MIEEIKTVDAPSQPAAEVPSEQLETPPTKPKKVRSARPAAGKPEEVLSDGPGAGMTRSQVLKRWGEEMGEQILDAAAGRRPPFTRDLAAKDPTVPLPGTEEETSTGPHQDRGPIHLLPRPLDFKLNPGQFFKYWKMLSDDELSRVKVYAYRLWPIVDVNLCLTPEQLEEVARGKKRPLSTCLVNEEGRAGALRKPFDPDHWREEIYHRWGAGDYNFRLNDTHPAIKRTLCMTSVIGELRDMDTYPPAVDMRTVVTTDQGNESYLRWRQLKGLPNGRKGESREEDEDMANTKVLTDALVTMTREQREVNKQNHTAQDPAGTLKALGDTMTKAAEANNTILTKSMDTQLKLIEMRSAQIAAPPPPPQQNIDGVIKLIIDSNEKRDLAYREASEKAATAQAEANKQVMTMILGNQSALEKRLEAAEARSAQLQSDMMKMLIEKGKPVTENGAAAGGPGPMTPASMMGEMSKMLTTVFGLVDKVAELSPRGRADEGSIWSRIAEKAIEVAPNVMYNYSIAQKAAAGVKGAALPEPQAPDQGGDDEESAAPSQEEATLRFLDTIETPLIHALTSGDTGQGFGALMMKTFGADTYEFIAAQSDDTLFQTFQRNTNIWTTVQKMSARFVQFLAEFRDRPTVYQIFQRMNTMAGQPHPQTQPQSAAPTPAPAPAPAPAAKPASTSTGTPDQVSRRLKPGQRIVHTPTGKAVVDATATVVPPDTSVQVPAPPPPSQGPDPVTPTQATA